MIDLANAFFSILNLGKEPTAVSLHIRWILIYVFCTVSGLHKLTSLL